MACSVNVFMSLSHPTKVDEPNNSEIDEDKEVV
jgi:hypothetical protein